MPSTTSEPGTPKKIYFDDEALAILDAHASALGDRKRSLVVCALLRALAGRPAKTEDAPIVTQLKRVFGREQFVSFLKAVAGAMPKGAEAIIAGESKQGYEPEAWKIKGAGVLAFYSPTDLNVGALFSKASQLKSKHRLDRVFVVTTNGNMVDASVRQDLAGANIVVVGLADLAATLKHVR